MRMSSSRPRSLAQRKFRGMTLLELILALALSGLLLMAISMAVQVHWRAFDVKLSGVEEAQLVTAILRNISDDIRSTLKSEPPNIEGLNLTSLAPMDDEPLQDPPIEQPTNDPLQDPPTEGEMTSESGPSVIVGLYGSATQLQFDISRLPRVDQFQSLETSDGAVGFPSDVKTVVYFLCSEGSIAGDGSTAMGGVSMGGNVTPSSTGAGRGLMRAESDRAVSAFGEVNGSTDSLYGDAKLLAAEVTSIQFQYFDGTEWLAEWNSDEQGGLPTAIEVLLTVDSVPNNQSGTPAASTLTPVVDFTAQSNYRMVVQLPVGGISPSTEEPTENTEPVEMPPAE